MCLGFTEAFNVEPGNQRLIWRVARLVSRGLS